MTHLQTQICIVGAGPAGATASLYLSRYGIAHVVVDRQAFPRDKVCGESYDGRVYRILSELCPQFLEHFTQGGHLLQSWNYHFQSPGIDLPVVFPRTSLPRLCIPRSQLDVYLFEQLAQSPLARVIDGMPIHRVLYRPDAVRLVGSGLTIDATLVLMATGSAATSGSDRSLYLFSRTYYTGIEPTAEKGLEVYYFQQPVAGCLFICPLAGDRYNVEIGVQKRAYKAAATSMEQLLQAYIHSRPHLRRRFRQARALDTARGTAMLLPARVRWSEPGLICLGAAAFCVNPVTGLGVGNAMTMGKLAAQLIRDHRYDPAFSRQVVKAYRRSARRKFRAIRLLDAFINTAHRHFGILEPLLSQLLRWKMVRRLLL